MPEKELREQINAVVEARQKAETARGIVTASRIAWTEKNQGILVEAETWDKKLKIDEDKLHELTLKAYAETGNKVPAVGVGIRERTVLTYDNKIAFDWAKAHKMALKLDTSAFEKIAKADPPDFVKITTEPQATIATELEKVE